MISPLRLALISVLLLGLTFAVTVCLLIHQLPRNAQKNRPYVLFTPKPANVAAWPEIDTVSADTIAVNWYTKPNCPYVDYPEEPISTGDTLTATLRNDTLFIAFYHKY